MAGQRVSPTITGPGPYFFYARLLLAFLGTLFGFFWPPWGPYGPYGLVPQISCLALPTNIKNRSYMQVLFSLFHCKPIWAHFLAFLASPEAWGFQNFWKWCLTPIFTIYLGYQPKRCKSFSSLFRFSQENSMLGLFFAIFGPPWDLQFSEFCYIKLSP